MKKAAILRASGYALLFIAMLSGDLLLRNSRAAIAMKVSAQEEAAKPAEIKLTLIAPMGCPKCVNGEELLQTIEKQNVRILDSQVFPADSAEAVNLINTYDIKRLPAIIVTGEYGKENVREDFAKFGGEEKNQNLVIQTNRPVYFDLASQGAAGLVDVIYLADSGCKDCYDPQTHKPILANTFGVTINTEKTVDASSTEGRALIKKYALAEVPTLLLSTEARAYEGLVGIWKQVGSIESDGEFIFRQNSALGSAVYKNLKTGKIVRPQSAKN